MPQRKKHVLRQNKDISIISRKSKQIHVQYESGENLIQAVGGQRMTPSKMSNPNLKQANGTLFGSWTFADVIKLTILS